tara:strand:+ start:4268 stop:5155 length:888 start_codon:yes stop_codon:yes gene_type:complete
MQSMTSISGGKTSAYLAANYKTDFYIFALVRTEDKNCLFKDRKLAQQVEDRIQKPFIGTLEDDIIINTIFDLEQYIQKPIIWVSGDTFDTVLKVNGNKLPNNLMRYCTKFMKLKPIFDYWHKNINKPINMNIGYRSTETRRAENMKEKLNKNGLLEFKTIIGKHKSGLNKWAEIEWQKPNFPLINDFIERQDIEKYWRDKPVKFAPLNNCIGCFHRSAALLNKMSKLHPAKFEWFIKQEKIKNDELKKRGIIKDGKDIAGFKQYLRYEKIKEMNFTLTIPFDYDGEGCESGFCGL